MMSDDIYQCISESEYEIIKKEYYDLLNTGMFFEFFPSYSGNWADDRKEFEIFWFNRLGS